MDRFDASAPFPGADPLEKRLDDVRCRRWATDENRPLGLQDILDEASQRLGWSPRSYSRDGGSIRHSEEIRKIGWTMKTQDTLAITAL